MTGDLVLAEALLAEARHTGPDLTATAEIAVAASFLLINGDGDVVSAYRLLLGALGSRRDVSEAAATQAIRTLALTCRLSGRPDFWDSLDQHLRGASPDLSASVYLGLHLADPARSTRAALGRLDAEVASFPQQSDPAEIVRVAGACSFVDRLPACRKVLERVAREELADGAVITAIDATALLAYEAYLTGRWYEALRLADDAAELAEAHGFQLQLWNARTVQAYVAAGCGNRDLTQAIADEMIRWAAARGIRRVQSGAWYASARAALSQSDFETAYQHATAISQAGQLASREPHALLVFLDLIEAALRTGRVSEASAHVQAVRRAGVATLSGRLALLADAAAALVAPDDEAFCLFERAVGSRCAALAVRPGQGAPAVRRTAAKGTGDGQIENPPRHRAGRLPQAGRGHLGGPRGPGTARHRADAPGRGTALRGGTDAAGTRNRAAGCQRAHQQADRQSAVSLAPHRRRAPVPEFSEAGHHDPRRAQGCACPPDGWLSWAGTRSAMR